jgi:hypothetical protein
VLQKYWNGCKRIYFFFFGITATASISINTSALNKAATPIRVLAGGFSFAK